MLVPPPVEHKPLQSKEEEALEEVPENEKRFDPLWGTRVLKGPFRGKVEDIERGAATKERLYRIRYEDGDTQHMTAEQVTQYEDREMMSAILKGALLGVGAGSQAIFAPLADVAPRVDAPEPIADAASAPAAAVQETSLPKRSATGQAAPVKKKLRSEPAVEAPREAAGTDSLPVDHQAAATREPECAVGDEEVAAYSEGESAEERRRDEEEDENDQNNSGPAVKRPSSAPGIAANTSVLKRPAAVPSAALAVSGGA